MSPPSRQPVAYSLLGECARKGDSVITRLMADKLSRPQMLSLAAGFTDNRVLPQELVAAAVARLQGAGDRSHLQYGLNRGRPGLRRNVLELIRSYPGEQVHDLDEGNVIITNGSQQALYILVQMLCDPGDIVLVESPSYFVFLELLHGLGVRPLAIPADAAGRTDFAGFEQLLADLRAGGELERVKLAYFMGAFANPSTRCISEDEKNRLARVFTALERPVPVIEDMAYRELYFSRPFPARSLLSLEAWKDHPVIYAGTFTKPFATGLKVGFLVSRDGACLDTVAKIKGHQDFGTANFSQAIIEQVFGDGLYFQHLDAIRGHYADKRDVLTGALAEHGLSAAGWTWDHPEGGLLLWARGPEKTDTRLGSDFHRRCVAQEVLYVPGDLCFAGGAPWNHVRLSFGALERELIPEAARRFCAAAEKSTS